MASSASFDILKRMFHSPEALSPEVAQYFMGVTLTDADHKRIAELSDKANEGELSPDEHDELGLYVLLIDFLTIMHSRAEDVLRAKTPVLSSTQEFEVAPGRGSAATKALR